MKVQLSKLWRSIRRNPVINAVVFAVLAQLAHDYLANQIDWTNICGYLATLLAGVVAREFTVPLSKHQDVVAKLLTEGLESDRNSH